MVNVVFKPHRAWLKAATPDPQKLFAMLRLSPTPGAAARPSLALALVVDTSGSMRLYADQERYQAEVARLGLQPQQVHSDRTAFEAVDLPLPTRLDQAIRAAHALADDHRLGAQDQIAIIHFDDDAHTLLPLTPLAHRQVIHEAVERLRHCWGDGTHLGKGLRCAQEELGGVARQCVTRILALTDGVTFDEADCRALARQLAEANLPVISTGVGTEYNEQLLLALAQMTGGRPYHLSRIEDLGTVLSQEVEAAVREIMTDLQATVSTVKGTRLDSLSRVYPSLADISLSEQPYRLGNLSAGDETVFILELTVSGIPRPASRARLARIALSARAQGPVPRADLPPQDLIVGLTEGDAAVTVVDPEVIIYVQQRNVDWQVQEAIRQATVNPARATQLLEQARSVTLRLNNPRVTQMLNAAIQELTTSGALSPDMLKTVALGSRTMTIRISQKPEG